MQPEIPAPARPWWRHGYVWLVISGPVCVAVAAVVTTWLAVRGADPVVEADYYRRGMQINQRLARGERPALPALQGRNHAATPAR